MIPLQLAITQAKAQPRQLAGAGNGREDESRVADRHSKPTNQLSSDSWDRILPRLARDAPEILERVKSGEISSARAAAIEAGIIKPVRTAAHHRQGRIKVVTTTLKTPGAKGACFAAGTPQNGCCLVCGILDNCRKFRTRSH